MTCEVLRRVEGESDRGGAEVLRYQAEGRQVTEGGPAGSDKRLIGARRGR